MTLNGLWGQPKAADISRASRLAVAIVAIVISVFVLCGLAGIRINASTSLPIGLYAESEDGYAPLIEFCPPEPWAALAIQRGYRTAGVCADGATPLMKPIVAREGDVVEVLNTGVSVNGRLIPNSVPRSADTRGRPMPIWPIHSQRVVAGTVWVVSSYNPRSFDSRYFGPISLRSITARLRPVIVTK